MQTTIQPAFSTSQKVFLIITLWGVLAFFLGKLQFFYLIPSPFFGVTVILILVSLIVLYFKNKSFQVYSNRIPLQTIALLHSWRIFAGWVFFSFSDVLPETFVKHAAYGDVIAGFLGLAVLIAGKTKLNHYIFNILGMADFILAVSTGIYLTIIQDPQMDSIVNIPLIMIPLFGVPISGYTHFIALYRLSKMSNYGLMERMPD